MNTVPVAMAKGGVARDLPVNAHILFWYNNPGGRGQKGWRRGFVRESHNEYVLTYDEARSGETRRFLRRCMTQLTIL